MLFLWQLPRCHGMVFKNSPPLRQNLIAFHSKITLQTDGGGHRIFFYFIQILYQNISTRVCKSVTCFPTSLTVSLCVCLCARVSQACIWLALEKKNRSSLKQKGCSQHSNRLLFFYWLTCFHSNRLTLRLQSQTSLLSRRIQHVWGALLSQDVTHVSEHWRKGLHVVAT